MLKRSTIRKIYMPKNRIILYIVLLVFIGLTQSACTHKMCNYIPITHNNLMFLEKNIDKDSVIEKLGPPVGELHQMLNNKYYCATFMYIKDNEVFATLTNQYVFIFRENKLIYWGTPYEITSSDNKELSNLSKKIVQVLNEPND